ncbi:MAG: TonB-dependent siderophore receptor [Alphaproteobacteria bacterium]|nr:TonB-dependent siderophore receptor [Alphaproteobacteria bacterium]
MPINLLPLPSHLRSRLLSHGVVAAVTFAAASVASGSALAQQAPTMLPPVSVQTQGQVDEASPLKRTMTSQSKYGGEIMDTPQSITVVTEELMEEQHVIRMRDALRNVPGISLGSGEGGNQGDTIFLRGFSTRGDMYLDGVRDFGSYNRDTFALQSVEVLKGASSTIFGRGSTGGVINNVSKEPISQNLNEVDLSSGTSPSGRGTGDFNYVFNETTALRFNAMAEYSETTDRNYVNSQRWGIFPSLTFGMNTNLEVNFNYLHQAEDNLPDLGIPFYFGKPAPVNRNTFYGYADFDYEKTYVDVATNRVKWNIDSAVTLTNSLRYGNESREQSPTAPRLAAGTTINTPLSAVQVTRSKPTSDRDYQNITDQSDFLVTAKTWDLGHTINTGVEFAWETFKQTNYVITGNPNATLINPNAFQTTPVVRQVSSMTTTDTNSQAFYIQDKVAVTDWLDLLGGFRFDRFEATLTPIPTTATNTITSVNRIPSGRAAAIVKPDDIQSYYFNWGTSANPSAENFTLANNTAAVAPETSEIYEIGAKYDLLEKRLGIQAAIYKLVKNNTRIPDSTGSFFVLDGRQMVQGGELSVVGKITDKWQTMTGLSVMSSDNSSTQPANNGKDLVNTPSVTWNIWTTYDMFQNFTVGGGVFYVGEYYADVGNQNQIPAYTRVDMMASYKIDKNFALQLNIQNLLDKQYFTGSGGNVLPGAGRTGILTGTYKF